jgi:serine/threonine protein kinase
VLNAEDQQLYVAKEVHLDSLSEVERMAALNEVDIMATLDHPNIIKYVESFVQKKCGTPTKLCIVMEYAEGGDLGKCAKAADGEELSEEDILDRFIEICFAVDYCHQQNIMHRDLKLENVFLTSSGHIKLGDFGMSQNLDGPTEIMEDLVGTPYYFSPEIINGLPCGTKSDVWSLGVLLYKLMAHRYPFKGRGLPELLVRIAKGRYEALPDHFSAELRGLVDSLLTADCDARLSASDILRLPLIQRRLGRWEETAASDDGYVRRLKDTHGPSVWQATSKKRPSTAPIRRSVTEELVKIVVSHATEESGPSELDALRPFSWPPRTVSPDDVVSSRSPSAVGLTPKIMLWDGGSSYDRVLAPTATAGDSLLQTCTGKKKQLPALKSPSEPAACPHQPALAKLHSLSAASTAVHTHSTGSGTFSEVTNVGCPKYGEQLAPIDHPGLQSLHEFSACSTSPAEQPDLDTPISE